MVGGGGGGGWVVVVVVVVMVVVVVESEATVIRLPRLFFLLARFSFLLEEEMLFLTDFLPIFYRYY